MQAGFVEVGGVEVFSVLMEYELNHSCIFASLVEVSPLARQSQAEGEGDKERTDSLDFIVQTNR